ncbi:hypothetical protein DJ531_06340 [Sulfolobus sp. A20-N-F6]|nr:hypothetical protein DJ531_06340 [Sulfolobus sp. A20-N-F6]
MDFKDLVRVALSSITFREGVREAKIRSPQSFAFHTISVGTIAYEICRTIYEKSDIGKKTLDELAKTYGIPWEQLCFFGGFIHDWNKLPGGDETKQSLTEKEKEAREIIARIAKLTENPNINPDLFIRKIALMAEGPLPDTLHLPLWIAIKLGDMLMISDIVSVNDVYYFKSSPSYSQAVNALKSVYGIELRVLSSSPRLFTLIASRRLVERLKTETIPLISYTDGLVYLSNTNSKPILLSELYSVMEELLYGSGSEESLNNVKEKLKSCLEKNIDVFRELELNPAIIDDKEKIKQIPNSIFPSKICKPFEDLIGLLKPESVSKLIDDLVSEYKEDAPWALILYFTEKSNRKDQIKKELGIGKVNDYVKAFKSSDLLDKLVVVLKKVYAQGQRAIDHNLLSFVKKSFGGDIVDDLSWVNKSPLSYCVVCGMPIYEESARFTQYGFSIGARGGTVEIFIPRAKAMANIDSLRDDWKICPFCNFEAGLLSGVSKPPFMIVSFYPGIPVRLLESIYIGTNYSSDVFKKVKEDSYYYDVFVSCGGELRDKVDQNLLISYLSSKVLVPFRFFTGKDMKISTRLSKKDINDLMRYTPLLSIVYLTSPVFISSNIMDIPMEEGRIKVDSVFNYSWMSLSKETKEANYKTLLTLLAYKAKYDTIASICKGSDLENCVSSIVEESDLYYAVDPSLFVISFGLGIGSVMDESKLQEKGPHNPIISHLNFLNFVMEEVSEMGETLSSSINSLALELVNIVKKKSPNPSKYDVIGFFRDGVETFFRTSSLALKKEDRINLAVSDAISSLDNKYSLSDDSKSNLFFALRDIFEKLYDIENNSDRSLAIRIANSLSTWIYLQFLYFGRSGERK